jgi:translation initiation factor 3 subunit H
MAVSFAEAAARERHDKQPLQRVQLAGLAVLKIAQHCRESEASLSAEATVTGQLLGLDVGSTLEVTDCFPYPVREGWACLLPALKGCTGSSLDM